MYVNAQSRVHIGEEYSEEWSDGQCSVRLGTQPTALHHCQRLLLWGPLGGPLCRWPCYHRWITRGMCQKYDLKISNGGERTESKCRKDEDHDLWCGPGLPAEFRQVSMHRLSHCGQQQHLLQRLQALGMQWAQVLDKGSWLQMDGRPQRKIPSRTWQGPTRKVVARRW